MLATSTLPLCSTSMTSRGTPRPATNSDAPPSTTLCASSTMRAGTAARRSTPNGFVVSLRPALTSDTGALDPIVAAPRVPKPPASETAATTVWYETPPMPASITGCSMPSISVSRVCIRPAPSSFPSPHGPHSPQVAPVSISLDAVGNPQASPQVAVIMASDSYLPTMQAAIDALVEFGVSYEARIVSAHRTPEVMVEYARTAADRGIRVIIAGAGGAAHLPGMTASMTPLPVIGVPVALKQLDGLDSLLSIVQMPAGVPAPTGAIRNARNAGLLAVRILATSDEKLRAAMERYQADLTQQVRDKDAKLR